MTQDSQSYDYDLFVIGGGSGGTRASRIAAGFGARVAVAEDMYLGGTCVNVGCIPKKLFVYASHFAEDFEDAAGFGWTVGARQFDWSRLIENKDAEILRLNGIYDRLIRGAGADIFDGRAKILDRHTVEVNGTAYRARYILVAVGGWPQMPEIEGVEHAISSNEVFYLNEFPRRILIVGGGFIAVEFAGVFNGLGAKVTQLYRGPLFLRGFDDDMRAGLAEEMGRKGVDLRFNTVVSRIEKTGSGLRVHLTGGAGDDTGGESVEVDQVLFAIGRRPRTQDLGLESAGVKVDQNGAIPVDEFSRTNVDNIYAVGDVTDRINLTPVAIREGHCFAETVFNNNPIRPNHENVPSAVFSQPAIGTCGLTEAEARERFGEVDIYRSSFRALKHTLSGRGEKSVMKLVVEPKSDRVVGCHILSPEAAEIMQGIAIAIKCGAKKADFDATVGIHPTSAEELVSMRQKIEAPAAAAR